MTKDRTTTRKNNSIRALKKAAGILATVSGCALIVGIQIGSIPSSASLVSFIAIPGGLLYSAYVDLKPLMDKKRRSGRWS